MENIILQYGEFEVPYNIISAPFDVAENKLDLCIELEIADQDNDEWPPEILIRLANLVLEEPNRSLHVRDETKKWDESVYDASPHAYIYGGFHHTHTSAWLDIQALTETKMVAGIKIVTNDLIRYDERAKDNLFVGVCTLTRGSKEDMWGP